jgi:hypothetical protein
MKPSFIQRIALMFSMLVLISACGGGGGSAPPATDNPPAEQPVALSGKVADGYLSGARVCLDINRNKKCDADEPSGTSGAGGAYNFQATQAQIDAHPLLVEVTADTIDEDTNTAVGKAYVMSAPAGSDFVSPLTTMVQTKIDANPSLSTADAESLVKSNLGLAAQSTASLFEDYVAAKTDSSNTDAAEYGSLHNIAKVTARVMADNYERVTTAAAAANTDLNVLVQIIVDSVIAELETITAQVQAAEQDGSFDDSDLVSVTGNISNIDISDLDDKINQVDVGGQTATVSSILDVLQGGVTWFWGSAIDDEYEYGIMTAGTDGTIQETSFFYNSTTSSFEQIIDNGPADRDIYLGTNGWESTNQSTASISVASDGSIDIEGGVDIEGIRSVSEVDLNGKNIALSLVGKSELPPSSVASAATFSQGAIGYLTLFEVKDTYGIGYFNDGICTPFTSNAGTNCAAVFVGESAAQSLVDTIGQQHSMGGDKLRYTLEGSTSDTSGTVSYTDSSGTTLATATWSLQTINGESLIVFDIPRAVRHLTDEGPDTIKAGHAVYDGYVRIVWIEAGGLSEELLFNATAREDIVANFVGSNQSTRALDVSFAFVQNRQFENGGQDHRGVIGILENGSFLPSSEIASATLTGPGGVIVPDVTDPVPNVFSGPILRLGSWNPTNQQFESIGTIFEESGAIVRRSVDSLPAGTYTFDITLTDGTQFSHDVSFSGTQSAPLVPASSISGTFQQDGSFQISWAEPNQAFDQYRVYVNVNDRNLTIRSHLSAGVDSIVIPASAMAALLAGSTDTDVEVRIQTRLQNTLGNHARNHSNVVSVAIPANSSNFGTIVGAWGNAEANAPGMLVFYAHGGYIVYSTDAQDCPGGGVEYGTYSYDGSNLTISNVTDQNGQCGLKGVGAPAQFTYTANIINGGNQLDIISGVPEDGTASFPRVSDGNPNSVVGGWAPFSSLEPDGGLVFYANGNYIVHQAAGSDPNCAAGGVEYGTYDYDGTTLSGNSIRDDNQTCGMSSGIGGFTISPVTISNNTFIGPEGDGDQFPRVETSTSQSMP